MANGIDKGIGSFDPNKTYRAFLERQNPYRPFGDRLTENLEKAGNVPKPTYFGPGDTLGGELIRGLGNLALFGTDAIVRGSGYAAAPLAAGIDALASPTYQAYLEDEIFPQISNMKAQRDRLTGLAEAFSTPRSGPVGASGIIAGGPTYRQTATPADQDAALRSQLAAAQEAGDVYLDENTGQIIGDSALMRNQMDDPMAERIGGAKLSVPDELDAVDYDTVSQFINEGLGSGKKESGIISDDTSVDGADTKESDSDPLLMTGTAEQDVGTTDGTAGSGGTTQQKKQNLYGGLLKQSLDSYNDMIGNAPSAAKTIEEYKQEFSEATGIDISGQPDNSAALTAFGLALMQNKAGKGFNVGELLSETGKAGEKALPLMAEARKEARSGQIAAGQFALAQRATDTATRQKYLNEAETYIRGRRDAILGAEVARIQTIEDDERKIEAAKELERVKYGYDYNLKKIDAFKEISKDQFKVDNVKDLVPLTNLPNLKITYGKSEVDGSPRLLYPAQQVGQLGTALADIKEGQGSIDYMIGELELIKDQPGGINLQKAKEIAQGLTQSFGYTLDAVPQFNDKGEYIGTEPAKKPLADVAAVRQRLIAQFKRFLTQETGNGISNVDVRNIEELMGKIDFGGDPNTAIKRLREVREIFNASENKLQVALKDFDNRDYYMNDEEYNLTRSKISDAIVASYNLRGNAGASDPDAGSAFDFTEDADGIRTYKMF